MDSQVIELGQTEVCVGIPGDERLAAFWTMFVDGRFEPGTMSVLRRHLHPGATFIDVGAWIGPFTLLAASLGASVLAYEPDPQAVVELRANLERNPTLAARVAVHEIALATHTDIASFVAPEVGLGNGRSRLAADGRGAPRDPVDPTGATAVDVFTVDARDEAATGDWTSCTLLKLDIEGAEHSVVPRLAPFLRSRRPALLLSLHGPDPTPVLARRFGQLRLVPMRLAGAVRRAPVLWAVRSYHHRFRAADNRSDDWRPLSRWALALLAVRVGETELHFHD